ncbi:MAG: pyroglutamyl-peptidase I [Hyphomicrobiaceae bacterium]|nr:pyroglutamyl-peptidase I [Hyphomicrobiaceae bacterium]
MRSGGRLLLTGFGAFPGVADNATERLVPQLADRARARWPDTAIVAAVLPVSWTEGPAMLRALLTTHAPHLALHFGVSGQARGLVLETRAANTCRAMPDAAGSLPPRDLLAADGCDSLPATYPAALIRDRLAARAIAACLSEDAGGYLCNAILHTSLLETARSGLSGFIHVPADLGETGCPLSWDAALTAGLVAIEAGLTVGPHDDNQDAGR